MRVIKEVIENMDETLCEADKYYKQYLEYKEDFPKIASTSLEMAKTHLDLYSKWHSVVVGVISDYKQENADVPSEMKAIWSYEHEKLTDEYNELKYKINNSL